MASGPITQVADIVVPSIFTAATQQLTQEKARLIQSGAAVRDPSIDALLSGGGLTFNLPSFRDLDSSDVERVTTDTAHSEFGGVAEPNPFKIQTSTEIGVRLSRNASWSSADLAAALAGVDPIDNITNRVGYYWARRLQAAMIAVVNGVFADNAAAPSGTEHVLNDMTVDISSAAFVDGTTNFSAEAFIDAVTTMGDSSSELGMVMVHSVVYARMQKNNLIDFIPDARGEIMIPTFLGREVIIDDAVPRSGSVYETWIFGQNALRLGVNTPKVATELERKPGAGNGGGQEILYNRVEWCLHPTGYRYAGTSPNGGPSNLNTTNNLANLNSWVRVFPERKQIKIARLITREA